MYLLKKQAYMSHNLLYNINMFNNACNTKRKLIYPYDGPNVELS